MNETEPKQLKIPDNVRVSTKNPPNIRKPLVAKDEETPAKVSLKELKNIHPTESNPKEKPNYHYTMIPGGDWIMKIPKRIIYLLTLATVPFRIFAFVMDLIVSTTMVVIIATLVAWYFKKIPDEYVVQFLGEIGQRGLAIIGKSGVIQ